MASLRFDWVSFMTVPIHNPHSAFRIRVLLSKGFLAEARKKKAAGRGQGSGNGEPGKRRIGERKKEQ
jgi:hypothetical protein